MSDVELAPCPFCGGDKLSTGGDDEYRQYWVECNRCEIVCESEYSVDDAIARWNRRAAPDSTPAPPADERRAVPLADVSAEMERRRLAVALIGWAADERNASYLTQVAYGTPDMLCIFCDVDVGGKHDPDCLHLRARRLQEGDDA